MDENTTDHELKASCGVHKVLIQGNRYLHVVKQCQRTIRMLEILLMASLKIGVQQTSVIFFLGNQKKRFMNAFILFSFETHT